MRSIVNFALAVDFMAIALREFVGVAQEVALQFEHLTGGMTAVKGPAIGRL